jgi:hypothetical protein
LISKPWVSTPQKIEVILHCKIFGDSFNVLLFAFANKQKIFVKLLLPILAPQKQGGGSVKCLENSTDKEVKKVLV